LALDKEVDVNMLDEDGFSPLLWLTNFCRVDYIYRAIKSLLLRSSVDIEQKTNQGLDALLPVCEGFRGNSLYYVIRLLLIHGLGVNSTSRDGRNALHYLLSDRIHNLPVIVKKLIQDGINVRATAADGPTLLIALSISHHSHPNFIPIAKMLIEEGCDLNGQNKKGQSALTIICDQHKVADDSAICDILKLLLQSGANVQAKDQTGRSAIDIIKQRYKNCCKISPIKILLNYLPKSAP
jgi:ankyrin repeat protein